MSFTPSSSHGPAAGTYLPTGALAGGTLDTTTYDNPVTGSGKMATLVLPIDNAVLAVAIAGDAHPRLLLTGSGGDGIYLGDGTRAITSSLNLYTPNGTGLEIDQPVTMGDTLTLLGTAGPARATRLDQVSSTGTITSGSLPTFTLTSGVGTQVSTSRDLETVTPVTFNPTAGSAASCQVNVSPDGITYSTLGVETEPPGITFDGTVHLIRIRLPAGWYLKMTATNATLGTTTYY